MLRCEPVVIAGCGSIGRRHAANLKAAGVQRLFTVDIDPAAARRLAAETGAEACPSLEEALSRGAATAFICTPTALHMSQALQAVDAGADLFVEKPLSHSDDGVSRLVSLAEERNVVTMVGCNMRFHPGPRTIKQLLTRSAIGEVVAARIHTGSYLPRWRPWQDYRESYSASPEQGGAILDCIHEIDLAAWYLGPAVVHSCLTVPAWPIALKTDGLAELLLRHRSGVLTSVHLNFIQRDYSRSCLIIGTEGTIEWTFRDREVRVFGDDGSIRDRIAEPADWDMNRMYQDELVHFIDATERRSQTDNPVTVAAETLRLALAARAWTEPVTT